jgi:V/A-type H+/Na+-transporting ATPase subunit F
VTAESSNNKQLAYIGPPGAGLGFRLSGMTVHETNAAEEMVKTLQDLVQQGTHSIIFIDEGLAKGNQEALMKFNQEPLPAIILLPNPTAPRHLAADNLQQLMIRAIGSDIFSNRKQ